MFLPLNTPATVFSPSNVIDTCDVHGHRLLISIGASRLAVLQGGRITSVGTRVSRKHCTCVARTPPLNRQTHPIKRRRDTQFSRFNVFRCNCVSVIAVDTCHAGRFERKGTADITLLFHASFVTSLDFVDWLFRTKRRQALTFNRVRPIDVLFVKLIATNI